MCFVLGISVVVGAGDRLCVLVCRPCPSPLPSCPGRLSVPFKWVAQWMGSLQKKLMKVKDDRVEITGKVLSSMKVIKPQAWEESFEKRILDLRDKELTQLLHYVIGVWVVCLVAFCCRRGTPPGTG